MARFRRTCTSAMALGLLGLTACGGGPQVTDDGARSGCEEQALIGGALASDAQWDAVAALGTRDAKGLFHLRCSATLVAPRRAVTAKHCVVPGTETGLWLALGPDADAPASLVAIEAVERASPDVGGVSELGSDVALVRLGAPVTTITPVPWRGRAVDASLIGSELTVLGFGESLPRCPYPTASRALRRVGRTRLSATRGNVFDFIYGGRSQFLARAGTDSPTADLERRYEHGPLLEGLEVWAERSSDGVQPCDGDSGGPVLLDGPAGVELVGVVSWKWRSTQAQCDRGAVLAVFGDGAQALLSGVSASP